MDIKFIKKILLDEYLLSNHREFIVFMKIYSVEISWKSEIVNINIEKDLKLTRQKYRSAISNLIKRGYIVLEKQSNKGCVYTINNIYNNSIKTIKIIKTEEEKTIEQKIVDYYNSTCLALPKIMELTTTRIRNINILIKKYSFEKMIEAIDKVSVSDFCLNKTTTSFTADFDFILKPNRFVNILEGKYDNKGGNNKSLPINRQTKINYDGNGEF